ncbi:hypothetical protein KQ1_05897 [Bacillus cereus BAG3O-1]|nr:hypothetical protein KQ1_05897 [Bacillus cereus BAG3O-1]
MLVQKQEFTFWDNLILEVDISQKKGKRKSKVMGNLNSIYLHNREGEYHVYKNFYRSILLYVFGSL